MVNEADMSQAQLEDLLEKGRDLVREIHANPKLRDLPEAKRVEESLKHIEDLVVRGHKEGFLRNG